MKEKYQRTEIEVVEFNGENVILTSGDPDPTIPPVENGTQPL